MGITIDGTSLTAITIDGTAVSRVTVDGVEVWSLRKIWTSSDSYGSGTAETIEYLSDTNNASGPTSQFSVSPTYDTSGLPNGARYDPTDGGGVFLRSNGITKVLPDQTTAWELTPPSGNFSGIDLSSSYVYFSYGSGLTHSIERRTLDTGSAAGDSWSFYFNQAFGGYGLHNFKVDAAGDIFAGVWRSAYSDVHEIRAASGSVQGGAVAQLYHYTPPNYTDSIEGFQPDAAGNLYAVLQDGNDYSHFRVVKIAIDGTTTWTQTFAGLGTSSVVRVAPAGQVFVIFGNSSDTLLLDGADGSTVWGPGTHTWPLGVSEDGVRLSSDGFAYGIDTSAGGNSTKLDLAGGLTQVWTYDNGGYQHSITPQGGDEAQGFW